MKIGICTDSGSGITPEEGKRLGITVVPMPFRMGEEEYFEDINMNRKYFYKFDGEGLRYEISEFIQCILNHKNSILLTIEEIRTITNMINQFNVANKVTF